MSTRVECDICSDTIPRAIAVLRILDKHASDIEDVYDEFDLCKKCTAQVAGFIKGLRDSY